MSRKESQEVSVIIPTYNRPGRLRRAAESVANQTHPVAELLVVDNGSTVDYTDVREYLDSLAIETTCLETADGGACHARNVGADAAEGDVLMFLDDDDRWRRRKVERQLATLDERTGLVYSARVAVDSAGNEKYKIFGDGGGDLSRTILLYNVIGTTSSPAIDAALFDAVGGFDEGMPGLQDWELWIRLCQHTHVGYDPLHTVEWTDTNGTEQMSSQVQRYKRALGLLRKKHADRFAELGYLDRRRATAHQYKSLGMKYHNARSVRKYPYLARSLVRWPSVGAAARLLPAPALSRLRRALWS
ncbi:glycosyltransferase family A protein [Natronococcus sp. A-GB1]|uniref:glycosyltransferase family 2 protein n=1 Tax=Natronococcus sp. A-GB1 TaxID=3037648 RepID=UPI00241CE01C|nr:glycosyltransferase family A protein [Natronococcus sp. A-GB1]MDG5761755.1 glycosyltransferase family A protein [Natronococcus sp. A-GB1]